MSDWNGDGWYRIGWSDGGMDWTSNGPIWLDSEHELNDEMRAAEQCSTDTHVPFAEYMGDGDRPEEQ